MAPLRGFCSSVHHMNHCRQSRRIAIRNNHEGYLQTSRFRSALRGGLSLILIILGSGGLYAQTTSTWQGSTSAWATDSNWSGGAMPIYTDTARFANTGLTTISITGARTIDTMNFVSGAPAYTFNLVSSNANTLSISGVGIVNESSNAPTFNISGAARLSFNASSTAGNAIINVNSGGYLDVMNTSNLGTATVNGGGSGIYFYDSVTAATATFSLNSTFDISALTSAGTSVGSLASSGSVALGSKNLTVGGLNASTTISGTIADGGWTGGTGGSLTKIGSGTLTLSVANTYTGATVLTAGTLLLGNSSAIAASTLNYNGGTLSFGALTSATFGGLAGAQSLALANASSAAVALTAGANNASTTYSGALSGIGSLIKSGTGTLTLTGANTHSGVTTLTAGTLVLGNADALSPNSNLRFNGGVLGITATSLSDFATGTGGGQVQWTAAGGFAAFGGNRSVTLNAGAALTWGSGGFNPTTLALGAATSDGAITFANAIDLGASNRTLQVNNGTPALDAVLSGDLSGAGGGLIKTGAGMLQITGAVSYTGATQINGGALLFTGTPSATSNIQFGGGVIAIGTGAPTDYTLGTGGGAVRWSAASSTGGFAAYGANRTVTLNAGANLTWASTTNFAGTSGILLLGNSASDATTIFANNIAFGTAARTVQVDDGSAALDATLSGNLTGTTSGGLTKTGAGTLSLTGANSYTGATIVTAGTLLIDGASALSTGGNTQINGGVLMLGSGAPTAFTLGTTAGTLRWSAAGGFAAYGADRTVSLNSGAALTWNTTTNFVATGNALILGANAADGNLTLSNAIALGTVARTVQVNDGSAAIDATLSGVISGTTNSAITKTGAGTLALTNTNTYTGNTNINAGKISVATLANRNSSSPLGTGATNNAAIALAGGTLQYTGATVTTNRLFTATTGGGGIEVTNAATTLTLNSAFFGANNGLLADALVKSGAGTLAFTGGDNSGLDVIVNAGTLQMSKASDTFLHSISQNLVVNSGGTAQFGTAGSGGDQILDSALVAINTGGILDFNSKSESFDRLTGGGSVTNTGTAANSTMTLGTNNGSATFSGVISNGATRTMAVTKMGTGTQIFTGANTYTGVTTINDGTLQIGAGGTSGSISGNVTLATDIFGAGRLAFNRSDDLTYSGVISGDGVLAKFGAGTLTLAAASTFSGNTTISAGTITLGHTNSLQNSTVTVGAGATLSFGALTTVTLGGLAGSENLTNNLAGANGLSVGNNNADTTFSGILSGSGNFRKVGFGTLTLTGANNYTGNTTITGGVLALSGAGTLGNPLSTLTVSGGALDLNSSSFSGGPVVVSGGTIQNGTLAPASLAAQSGTISANLTGGSLTLTKTTTGTLTLSGTNTYGGDTIVTAGVLGLASAGALPATSNVQLNGGVLGLGAGSPTAFTLGTGAGQIQWTAGGGLAAMDVDRTVTLNGGAPLVWGTGGFVPNGSSLTLGAPGAGGIITLANDIDLGGVTRALQVNIGSAQRDATLTGVLSGAGGITVSSGAYLTLSGNNTYAGGTTASNGRIYVGHDRALGTGTVTMTTQAIFDDGGARTLANDFQLNSTSGFVAVDGLTLDGNIAGSAGADVMITGPGTLTLNGANTYPGTTNLQAGTLVIGNDTVSGTGSALGSGFLSLNGGTLRGDGTARVLGNAVTLAANSVIGGASNLTFNGTLTNSGGNRTLTVSNSALTTIGAINLSNNNTARTLTITGTGNTAVTGVIANGGTGAGLLTKSGNGTLTLSGTNTYGGVTTVSGGVLSVSTLANGGSDSNIGRSSSAAANLVLNGGTLRYTGAEGGTDRLFTLGTGASGGAIDASGTGPLSLTSSGSIATTGTGTRTLTLTGSNTGNNTLGALIANQGSNATSLTKSGAGTWVVSGASTYTGVTAINGGILSASNLKDGGTASNIGQSSNAASNLVFSGGALRYTGGAQTTNRLFTLGADGGTLEASGSGTLGFVNTGSLVVSGTGDRTLVLSGTNTGANALAPVIADPGSGTTSLSKTGSGSWSLTGANTYSGNTTVTGGILKANNSSGSATGSGQVTVSSGGALGGSGIVSGSVVLNGTLSPGNSVGHLTTGNLTASSTGIYEWEISDATGSEGTGWDLATVNGSISFDLGATFKIVSLNLVHFDPASDFSWLVATTTTGILGWQSVALNLSGFTNPYSGTFSLGVAGNDLKLNYDAVPEPATWVLAALGLAGLMIYRRKRRKIFHR